MYKYKKVRAGNLDRYVVSIDNHMCIMEALREFCADCGIVSGVVSGIGAIRLATFRFLNPETKAYVDKEFDEQMEITNLIGNISELDGKLYLHVHVTAALSDCTCVGGHLLDAEVNGACELLVESFGSTHLPRVFDKETGLNLYDF